jgi:hypothetical protein
MTDDQDIKQVLTLMSGPLPLLPSRSEGNNVILKGIEEATRRGPRGGVFRRRRPRRPLSDREVLTPGPLAVIPVSAISVVAGARNHRNRLASPSRWTSSDCRASSPLCLVPVTASHGNWVGMGLGISWENGNRDWPFPRHARSS